ncbi:MAG TPA: hypothetical protein VFC24_15250 [Casimicrobiaceae bacterium]|nr:hypothetical protein [Casimicrobiaceae bacterium]
MPSRSGTPSNLKRNDRKNVRDPAEHPMGMADSPKATRARRGASGDDNMRLPHEHDETGDREERAGGVDKLMQQAEQDATSGQEDTDRRSDAVENFDRGHPPRQRGGKVR